MRAIDPANVSVENNSQRQTDGPLERPSAIILPFQTRRSTTLAWWRTRHPSTLSRAGNDPRLLRTAVKRKALFDPDWHDAVNGDPTAAIAIAVRAMKHLGIDAPEIDATLSAVLACAIDGDTTCPIVLSSALRRRSRIDPSCGSLAQSWLRTRFASTKRV